MKFKVKVNRDDIVKSIKHHFPYELSFGNRGVYKNESFVRKGKDIEAL